MLTGFIRLDTFPPFFYSAYRYASNDTSFWIVATVESMRKEPELSRLQVYSN